MESSEPEFYNDEKRICEEEKEKERQEDEHRKEELHLLLFYCRENFQTIICLIFF
jgi:hypothetical protein